MTWEFYVGVGVATTLFTKTKMGVKKKCGKFWFRIWDLQKMRKRIMEKMGFAVHQP